MKADCRDAILYRAPFVVPVNGAIIADGAVLVSGEKIAAVGAYTDLRGQGTRLVDLEQRILTPGLLNCHTHLELSYLAQLGQDTSFASQDITLWIRSLLEHRRAESAEIINSARAAVAAMSASGIVYAADIGNTPACANMAGAGIAVDFFGEFLGLAPGASADLAERLESLPEVSCTAHAPHTTHPDMIRQLKQQSLINGDKFPIHVAESTSEIEFLNDGKGAFENFIMERLGSLDFYEPPGCGAVEYLDGLGVLDAHTICVHSIHISEKEVEILAKCHAKTCLCPGSNRFLGVGRANPIMLMAKGIKPCLGTDSLASNPELNLWREMQILQDEHPALDACDIFAMATNNGAIAMGRSELGSLQRGKAAKILAVEFDKLDMSEVYPYLVNIGNPNIARLENGHVS